MADTFTPQSMAGRLVPAPEPERTWQATRDGADSYVYMGATSGTDRVASPVSTGVQLWLSRYSMWETQFQREIWPRAQYYWQLYRNIDAGIIPGPAGEWRDRTILPTIFKIIETLVARAVLSDWGGPKIFDAEGVEARDEDYELTVKTLMQSKIDQIGTRSPDQKNFISRCIEQYRYSFVTGHSWGKAYWRDETVLRKARLPIFNPDGSWNGKYSALTEIVDKIYNGLDYTWLPISEVAVDMTGANRWKIEMIHTTLNSLRRENAAFKKQFGVELYPDLATLQARTMLDDVSRDKLYKEPDFTEGFPMEVPPDPSDSPVLLWLCWDNFEGTLTKIANKELVLDHGLAPTPDGLDPLVALKGLNVPNQVYGDSTIRYAGPLAVYQTRLRRGRADELWLNLFQQFLVRRDANISTEWLFYPGGYMEVDVEPGERLETMVAQLPRRPIFTEAWSEDQYSQAQAEGAAGADAISMGTEATQKSRDVSASEVQQRVMQGAARFQLATIEREVNWKKRILQNMFNLIQQNMTQPEIVRVIGEDGTIQDKAVGLADLQLGVDIKVGGGLFEQARHEKKQTIQELVMLASNPVFGQVINPQPVLEEWFASNGFKNPKRFIKSPMTAQTEELGRGLQGAMLDQLGGGPGGGGGIPPALAGMGMGGGMGGPPPGAEGLADASLGGPAGAAGPSGQEPLPPPSATGTLG